MSERADKDPSYESFWRDEEGSPRPVERERVVAPPAPVLFDEYEDDPRPNRGARKLLGAAAFLGTFVAGGLLLPAACDVLNNDTRVPASVPMAVECTDIVARAQNLNEGVFGISVHAANHANLKVTEIEYMIDPARQGADNREKTLRAGQEWKVVLPNGPQTIQATVTSIGRDKQKWTAYCPSLTIDPSDKGHWGG